MGEMFVMSNTLELARSKEDFSSIVSFESLGSRGGLGDRANQNKNAKAAGAVARAVLERNKGTLTQDI